MTQTTAKQYPEKIQQLLSDPCISNTLKQAVIKFNSRDPVDALYDAQALHELMQLRMSEIMP